MSIPRIAIERPVTMFMISGVIILLGSISLTRLPVDLMPDTQMPTITVRVNYSGITVQAGPLASRQGIAVITGLQPARAPVELYWQLDAISAAEIAIFDVVGRRRRSIALAPGRDGVARWDGRDDEGARMKPGVYFARLRSGARGAVGRIVLID